jgi:hypothetical protein
MPNIMKDGLYRKILWIIVLIALLAGVIVLIIKVNRFLEIDRCLDHGGKWNYAIDRCDEH